MVGSPHVLVVEDDAVLRRAIGRAAHGLLEARFAETGAAALEALAQPPLPCFVLLDYALPDMNGLEVLRRLRAQPGLAHVPVVMFSSLEDAARRQEALKGGAAAWVRKPDDPAALQRTVRELCSKYGA